MALLLLGALPAGSAFLANVQDIERGWRRPLLVFVLGGALATVAIGAVMLAVLSGASAVLAATSKGALSIAQANAVLSDVARSNRSLPSYLYELTSVGLGSFAAAWAFLSVASRLYRRPIRTFITAAPGFRWQIVALGFAVTAPVIGVSVVISYLTGEVSRAPVFQLGEPISARALYVAGAAVLLFLAALAEEMLFRGWLLQQTFAFSPRILVVLTINGLLFSVLHFDPSVGGFVVRAAMGAAWSWMALRTAGLEFTAGAHLANNLLICLFLKPVTFAPAPRPAIDYGELAVEALGLALVLVVVEALARKGVFGLQPRRGGVGDSPPEAA